MGTDSLIRFITIAACCFNSFYIGKNKVCLNKKDLILLRAAMIFTVISDFLLIWTGFFDAGVLSFCIVQIIYSFRYLGKNLLFIRTVLPVVLFVAAAVFTGMNLLFSFAAAYMGITVFSTTGAFFVYSKYPFPNNLFIVFGMVLFLLCDIALFLYYAVFFNTPLNEKAFHAIWLFYLPAQALLSSSGRIREGS